MKEPGEPPSYSPKPEEVARDRRRALQVTIKHLGPPIYPQPSAANLPLEAHLQRVKECR